MRVTGMERAGDDRRSAALMWTGLVLLSMQFARIVLDCCKCPRPISARCALQVKSHAQTAQRRVSATVVDTTTQHCKLEPRLHALSSLQNYEQRTAHHGFATRRSRFARPRSRGRGSLEGKVGAVPKTGRKVGIQVSKEAPCGQRLADRPEADSNAVRTATERQSVQAGMSAPLVHVSTFAKCKPSGRTMSEMHLAATLSSRSGCNEPCKHLLQWSLVTVRRAHPADQRVLFEFIQHSVGGGERLGHFGGPERAKPLQCDGDKDVASPHRVLIESLPQ